MTCHDTAVQCVCMCICIMWLCHNVYTWPHGIMTLPHTANIWLHDVSIACACVSMLCVHVMMHTHMHMQWTGFNWLMDHNWTRKDQSSVVQFSYFHLLLWS